MCVDPEQWIGALNRGVLTNTTRTSWIHVDAVIACRYCLGAGLAMYEMKTLLALVARHYSFTVDNNTEWVQAIGKVPKVSMHLLQACTCACCACCACFQMLVEGLNPKQRRSEPKATELGPSTVLHQLEFGVPDPGHSTA